MSRVDAGAYSLFTSDSMLPARTPLGHPFPE